MEKRFGIEAVRELACLFIEEADKKSRAGWQRPEPLISDEEMREKLFGSVENVNLDFLRGVIFTVNEYHYYSLLVGLGPDVMGSWAARPFRSSWSSTARISNKRGGEMSPWDIFSLGFATGFFFCVFVVWTLDRH